VKNLGAEHIASLRCLAHQGHVLVSPFPDQPSPILASAWGQQLEIGPADDAGLDQFLYKSVLDR
jgi:hypothetical protein